MRPRGTEPDGQFLISRRPSADIQEEPVPQVQDVGGLALLNPTAQAAVQAAEER